MNPKNYICTEIDNLIKRIENTGAYITEDAKMDVIKIKKAINSLELNSNIYNDN